MGAQISSGKKGGKQRPTPNVNVTPLIDVVLVLLIIFMVVTPMMAKQFSFNLPEEPEEEENKAETPVQPESAADAPTALILTVEEDGTMRLNDRVITKSDAVAVMKDAFTKRENPTLFFDAKDKVPYQTAAEALDYARQAGAKAIAVLTKTAPAPAAAPEAAPATP